MLSGTKAQHEAYAVIAVTFDDVDGGRDGIISAAELDLLCEKAEDSPHRCDMDQIWEKEYDGFVQARTTVRAAMFHAHDTCNGHACGTTGLA